MRINNKIINNLMVNEITEYLRNCSRKKGYNFNFYVHRELINNVYYIIYNKQFIVGSISVNNKQNITNIKVYHDMFIDIDSVNNGLKKFFKWIIDTTNNITFALTNTISIQQSISNEITELLDTTVISPSYFNTTYIYNDKRNICDGIYQIIYADHHVGYIHADKNGDIIDIVIDDDGIIYHSSAQEQVNQYIGWHLKYLSNYEKRQNYHKINKNKH